MDMNIFEALISFNTAKLAKEKGFDIPCIATYKDAELYHHKSKRYIDLSMSKKWIEEPIKNSAMLDAKVPRYSAPTQSLLQKWLRDVHNIHIEIQSPDTPNETWGSHIRYINKFGNRGDCGDSETYEQALEAGLLEALKLIEDEEI